MVDLLFRGVEVDPWSDFHQVGDVMKQLKALKIDEKTMVFFASDNGAHLEGGHQIAFFNSTGGGSSRR